MPIIPSRRHNGTCKYKDRGRHFVNRCDCGVQIEGALFKGMPPIKRRSMGTTNIEAVRALIKKWENQGAVDGEVVAVGKGTPIADGINRFLQYSQLNRRAKVQTVYNYRVAFLEPGEQKLRTRTRMQTLEAFCKEKGIQFTGQITFDDLEELQRSWSGYAITTIYNRTTLLKTLFRFFVRKQYSTLDAEELILPDLRGCEKTKPFDQDEMRAVFAAAESNPKDYAMILFLRYSGLRISDAMFAPKGNLHQTRLILRQMKPGQFVAVDLPELVCEALDSFKHLSPSHWFWDGHKTLKYMRQFWYKRLKTVFKRAGIADAHPHMLRDTFAVEHLLSGMEVKNVSELLGHSSVSTTEKHYLYWVLQRQNRLDEQVKKSHAGDPILTELRAKPRKVRTLAVHQKTA